MLVGALLVVAENVPFTYPMQSIKSPGIILKVCQEI
jgi:hypothetical protein